MPEVGWEKFVCLKRGEGSDDGESYRHRVLRCAQDDRFFVLFPSFLYFLRVFVPSW